MTTSNLLNHITPAEIAAVADAADPDMHAHLDRGWSPAPIGKLDHFALMPDPATRAPSEDARLVATLTALKVLTHRSRRELAAVMAIGMLGGSAETGAAMVRAFQEGRPGGDEVDYLAGKTPLAEYLRRGLAKLGLG